MNLALSELPDFTSQPGTDLQPHHTGAIELAHSLEYLETAFQEARGGRPASRPFSDGCIPSTLDPTLCPEGTHVMSLFTQWVPSSWSDEPHREELEAYADRVVAGYAELAPNLPRSIIHRQVIGPYEMEHTYGLIGGNIFHGELSVDQLFHNRPAPGTRTSVHLSTACTRRTRRRTAAAACAASRVGRRRRPSCPTNGGRAVRGVVLSPAGRRPDRSSRRR